MIRKQKKKFLKKKDILRAHSLSPIIKFITKKLDVSFEKENEIRRADNYYFTVRYPGIEFYDVDSSDIDNCKIALSACKEEVDRIEEILKSRIQAQEEGQENNNSEINTLDDR